jgi:hypothetical protein
MFSVLSIILHDSRAGLRGKPTWQLPGAPAHKEHWNNLKYSANKSGFHAQKKIFLENYPHPWKMPPEMFGSYLLGQKTCVLSVSQIYYWYYCYVIV